MSSKINAKLGLRAQTKPRQATHGHAIDSRAHCQACGSRHCLKAQSSNGLRLGSHWCGACGTFFTPGVQEQAA